MRMRDSFAAVSSRLTGGRVLQEASVSLTIDITIRFLKKKKKLLEGSKVARWSDKDAKLATLDFYFWLYHIYYCQLETTCAYFKLLSYNSFFNCFKLTHIFKCSVIAECFLRVKVHLNELFLL